MRGMPLRVQHWLRLVKSVIKFDFNSAQSGNYNDDATWVESGHPGGGAGDYKVLIHDSHIVTLTVVGDAATDNVTINNGGRLQTTLTANGIFNDTTIRLNGGALQHTHTVATSPVSTGLIEVFDGSRLLVGHTNIQANRSFTFGQLNFGPNTPMLDVVGIIDHAARSAPVIFLDSEITHDGIVRIIEENTQAITLTLTNTTYAPGVTLTKRGTSDLIITGGTNNIYGSGARLVVEEGDMTCGVANSFNGAIVEVIETGRFVTVDVADTFSQATCILNGGIIIATIASNLSNTGHLLVQSSDSEFILNNTNGFNSRTLTFGTLEFAADDMILHLVNTRDASQFARLSFNGPITRTATINLEERSTQDLRLQFNSITFDPGVVITVTGDSYLNVIGGANNVYGAGSGFVIEDGSFVPSINSLNGATVWLNLGTVWTAAGSNDAFSGANIRLDGGQVNLSASLNFSSTGMFTIIADSTILYAMTDSNNSRTYTFGTLNFDIGSPTLTLQNNEARASTATARFLGSMFTNDGTVDIEQNDTQPVVFRLEDTTWMAGVTVTKSGGGNVTAFGSSAVNLLGGADVLAATSFTLIDSNTAITKSDTFNTAGGLWTKGGGTNDITATLDSHKGTAEKGEGEVTFAASPSGHVTLGGLDTDTPGNNTLTIGVQDFDDDINAVVARLSDNSAFSNITADTDTISMNIDASATTMYFAWDNVLSDLGCSISSVELE